MAVDTLPQSPAYPISPEAAPAAWLPGHESDVSHEISRGIGEVSMRGSGGGEHDPESEESPRIHHQTEPPVDEAGENDSGRSDDGPADGSPPTGEQNDETGEGEPEPRRFRWAFEIHPVSTVELGLMAEASDIPTGNLAVTPERVQTGEQIADIYYNAVMILRADNPICELADIPDPDTGVIVENVLRYASLDNRVQLALGTGPDEEHVPLALGEVQPPAEQHRLAEGDRLWVETRLLSGRPDRPVEVATSLRFDHLPDQAIALTDFRTSRTPVDREALEPEDIRGMDSTEQLGTALSVTRLILDRVAAQAYRSTLKNMMDQMPSSDQPPIEDENPDL